MKRSIRLLFVDDEEKFLNGMTQRLQLRDLVVDSFSNGADAVNAVAVAEEPYDVALIDLKMPGMDGEELLEKLKESVPAMEVVILTGHGSLESGMRTFRAGAYEYLTKPCELDDLLGAISLAYAKQVKARNEALKTQVETIVASAEGANPRELLRMLQDLDGPE